MSINTENWALFETIHREIDPPVEIVEERQWVRPANHYKPFWTRKKRLDTPNPPKRICKPRNEPRKGELRLKDFLNQKAELERVTYTTVWERFSRGKYPVTVRRVNSRVLFVRLRGEVGAK